MRRTVAGRLAAASVSGVVAAALWFAPGAVADAPASPPPQPASGGGPAAIDAAQARPAPLPTYPGPGGAPVPVGACGAVIGGRVWVLPCDAPQVQAYRRREAAAEAARLRRHGWTTAALGAGGDALLAGLIGGLEWRRRRRGFA
jgi:hypothetical protein